MIFQPFDALFQLAPSNDRKLKLFSVMVVRAVPERIACRNRRTNETTTALRAMVVCNVHRLRADIAAEMPGQTED